MLIRQSLVMRLTGEISAVVSRVVATDNLVDYWATTAESDSITVEEVSEVASNQGTCLRRQPDGRCGRRSQCCCDR